VTSVNFVGIHKTDFPYCIRYLWFRQYH